jgi:hypothetical protein
MTTGAVGAKTSFPVFNGYGPAQGAQCVPISLDFSVNNQIDFDIVSEVNSGIIDFAQSIWVDNSLNAAAVTFQFSQTGQKLVVPAYAQGIWPVIAPAALRCVATTTPAANLTVPIILLNVPMPMTQYGPVSVGVLNVTADATPIQADVTVTSVSLSGISEVAIAANAARKRLIIQAHPNNAGPIAFNWGAGAAVLASCPNLLAGQSFDTGVGPVSTQALNIIGTALDVLTIQES